MNALLSASVLMFLLIAVGLAQNTDDTSAGGLPSATSSAAAVAALTGSTAGAPTAGAPTAGAQQGTAGLTTVLPGAAVTSSGTQAPSNSSSGLGSNPNVTEAIPAVSTTNSVSMVRSCGVSFGIFSVMLAVLFN